MKHKFKIGQRVRVVKSLSFPTMEGMKGELIGIDDDEPMYRVKTGSVTAWVSEIEPIKRGRPVGSKNKQKSVIRKSRTTEPTIRKNQIVEPYKPSLGDTVRVVECVTGYVNHVGEIEVVDSTSVYPNCYWIRFGDKSFCLVSKVEPVEKKQLPSDTVTQIYYHLDMIIQLLDEQHIAGRGK